MLGAAPTSGSVPVWLLIVLGAVGLPMLIVLQVKLTRLRRQNAPKRRPGDDEAPRHGGLADPNP